MMESFSNLIEDIASIYSTDTIFILGKGPSADSVDPRLLTNSVVIGLNDAERIFPADITIFHAAWVKESVARNGLKSRLYITPEVFEAARGRNVTAPFVPLRQDATDLLMQRFQSDEFAIEEVLFLSAIKVAREIARLRARPQKVYMVGFDFSAERGYAHAIDPESSPRDDGAGRINMQEYFFLNTLYVLRNTPLEVIHVGERPFSGVSPAELNGSLRPSIADTRDTGRAVKIVAELTTNHFGDRKRLERMVRASAAAGADYVKLQKRDVASFYTAEQLRAPYVSPFGDTFADYRYALELGEDDFQFVDGLCRELGIDWFASILDQRSFEWMQRFQPTLVKLPSTISEHRDYLSYVAEIYRGGVVLSTGMTDADYEAWVLSHFGNCDRLFLMQCNSAYPTPSHDCNIGVVRHYHMLAKQHPHIVPAYSSHDVGAFASALAVAAGAKMVEKHVKLGNTEWAHFDAVAVDLTTPAFREYVEQVREAQLVVGSDEKRVNESEHHKYGAPVAAAMN